MIPGDPPAKIWELKDLPDLHSSILLAYTEGRQPPEYCHYFFTAFVCQFKDWYLDKQFCDDLLLFLLKFSPAYTRVLTRIRLQCEHPQPGL